MNLEFKHLLPPDFAPTSRVWIYQSSRMFSIDEALELEEILNSFTTNWLSHGEPVKGWASLFFGRFVILIADESGTTVGGCSTDSSVRMVKEIEKRFGLSLFDRNSLAFYIKDRIELLPLEQLRYAFENGLLNGETLYFNNLVNTKQELEDHWIVPVKRSWLAKRLKLGLEI